MPDLGCLVLVLFISRIPSADVCDISFLILAAQMQTSDISGR